MTWTILARDPASGQLGIATTTHAFGVGPVADWSRPGVAVAATQAFVDISYGPLGLDLVEQGASVADALDQLIAADEHREIRQVAFLDTGGEIAHFTGSLCVPFCGAVRADDVIVIGNMLAGEAVIADTLSAFLDSPATSLTERLLDGLDAGQAAGGDARGAMSAALRVIDGNLPARAWEGTLVDLRVDFAADPLVRLRADWGAHRAYQIFFGSLFGPGYATGPVPVTGVELDRALVALGEAQEILGTDREATLWQAVLLLRAGREDEARPLIVAALAARPAFATFIDGLHAIGAIPLDSDSLLREAP